MTLELERADQTQAAQPEQGGLDHGAEEGDAVILKSAPELIGCNALHGARLLENEPVKVA